MIIGKAKFDLLLDWLVEDQERLLPLLEPVSSQELVIYPVGLEVNNPVYDSEEVSKKEDLRLLLCPSHLKLPGGLYPGIGCDDREPQSMPGF